MEKQPVKKTKVKLSKELNGRENADIRRLQQNRQASRASMNSILNNPKYQIPGQSNAGV